MSVSKREPKYTQTGDEKSRFGLRKSVFNKFGPSMLGLDDRDPHLVVPQFVKSFLEWLFDSLSAELLIEEAGNNVVLWSHLPFFGKFLGDGVLLLWDVTDIGGEAKRNIVQSFDVIRNDYQTKFLPSLKQHISTPPPKLRCGIAQGQVTSIADGKDFVGLCINIASRLQKLADGAFSFAFTQKGLEPEEGTDRYESFRLIKIPIRGISKDERVYVLNSEFRKLSKNLKRAFRP